MLNFCFILKWMLLWKTLKIILIKIQCTSYYCISFQKMKLLKIIYSFKCKKNFFYYFLLSISRESIVLESNFEMQILMDIHVLRSPEFENHIFSVWSVCMCVCVCLYVCESVCLLSTQLKSKLKQEYQIWYSTFVSHTDAT